MEVQKVKGLKVGIVSTIEHVTTLMNELKVHGHTAVPLPELGDRYKIPTSCDVIVCRVEGTSHRAVSMCLEEARRNVRPVIFRNGTTRIMEKIHAAASGTWVQDSILPWANSTVTKDIEDLAPEELAAMKEEEERVRELTTCADYIRQLVEKGGAFHEGLLSLEPVVAKEVLCSVKYSSRDRVKRTAVLHLVDSLKKVRAKVVADQVENLLAEGIQSETIWWTSASGAIHEETVLHAGWSAHQLNQYVNALDSRVESIHYAVDKSDLVKPPEKVVVEEPEVAVEITQEVESPPSDGRQETVVVTAPEPMVYDQQSGSRPSTLTDSVEKEINELLEMMVHVLDTNGIESVPERLITRWGLSGVLNLNVVHMAGVDTTCCGKAGTKVSNVPSMVTCSGCMSTPTYAYVSRLFQSWTNGK